MKGVVGVFLFLFLFCALIAAWLFHAAHRLSALDPQAVLKLETPISPEQAQRLLAIAQPVAGSPSPTPKARVVILGMDGLDFQYLNPLIQQGKLPHVKRMMEEGTSATLLSIAPPSSAGAWPAIVTGCQAGKTDLLNFRAYDPLLRKIVLTDGRWLRRPALWDILGLYGKRSITINEPMSYPPHKIRGVMVSGLLAPEGKLFTYPETLSGALDEIGYKREAVPKGEGFFAPQSTLLRDLLLTERKRLELALLLMERTDWDLFFCMFSSTDRMMHGIGTHFTVGDLETNLLEMDRVLGAFLEHLPEGATLFLVSDHGFQFYERQFSVPRWLEQEGYWVLPKKDVSEQTPFLRLTGFLKKMKAKTSLPNIPGLHWPRSLQRDPLQPSADWERTKAISVETGGNWGSIWILKKKGEREKVEVEITEKLSRLVYPDTGEKAVKQILTGRTLFPGPYGPLLPDLVFELSGGRADFISSEKVFRKEPIYHHRREGVFIAWGWGIRKGVALPSAHIVDITPTALYLLGLPVSQQFDGRILKEALLPSLVSETPPAPIPDFPPVEPQWVGQPDPPEAQPSQEVQETLRSLGYLQ